MHLEEDLKKENYVPSDGGFDAIVCMGNSFAHLPDFNGDQREHSLAIQNFYNLVKPGGILMIDHRNYDYILDHGQAPSKNIYYNVICSYCHFMFYFNSIAATLEKGYITTYIHFLF